MLMSVSLNDSHFVVKLKSFLTTLPSLISLVVNKRIRFFGDFTLGCLYGISIVHKLNS